jgi:hypothetical protein
LCGACEGHFDGDLGFLLEWGALKADAAGETTTEAGFGVEMLFESEFGEIVELVGPVFLSEA